MGIAGNLVRSVRGLDDGKIKKIVPIRYDTESLAARFKAGDGLEGYLGRWLLLEAAGGDVEAEDNLATSRQTPLIRIVVGEKLNMEDIGTSWYPFKKKRVTGQNQGLQAEHHSPVANRHPLHAGCCKHGEAARDLSCGQRRQWA